jgi:hypothetical protein
VAGLALVSVLLVVVQPLFFHTGCTLCLVSAAISFVNAWLAHPEILASIKVVRGDDERGD